MQTGLLPLPRVSEGGVRTPQTRTAGWAEGRSGRLRELGLLSLEEQSGFSGKFFPSTFEAVADGGKASAVGRERNCVCRQS